MIPLLPRLALFKSDEPEFQSIAGLFGRHASSLELIHDLEEAAALVDQDKGPLHAILLPLRIRPGLTGISACIQAKAHPILSSIPALGFSPTKDRAVMEAFYGAGADSVFVLPFEPELVLMQAASLSRVYQIVKERIAQERDSVTFSSGIASALDASPEPIVIFDRQAQPAFLNAAALRVLALEPNVRESPGNTSSLFASLEEPLKGLLNARLPSAPEETLPFVVDSEILTSGKRRIPMRCTLAPILAESGGILGISAHLQSSAELDELQQTILFAQRSHSLSLLSSAGMLKFLEQQHGGYPVAPVQRFLTLSQKEDARCRLSPILTALIEVLDSIVPPGLSIITKMGAETENVDLAVALRPSDALQLFGHVVLHAARAAGVDGEITLSTQLDSGEQTTGEGASRSPSAAPGVVLLCTAEQGPSRALITRDLVEESMSRMPAGFGLKGGPKGGKLLFGLEAAQVLADRYKVRIEFKTTATSFKVRLRLPRC